MLIMEVSILMQSITFLEVTILTWQQMVDWYDQFQIYQKMVDFEEANNDFDPVCLRGEHWELIQYELERWTNKATQFFKPS